MEITEPAWIEPVGGAFRGPLKILIDGGVFSTAEDFVLPFKDNGRALIAGEVTGGSSGQPYVCDLGGGMQLWVGTKRQYLPDGGPFEGVGIAPDDA